MSPIVDHKTSRNKYYMISQLNGHTFDHNKFIFYILSQGTIIYKDAIIALQHLHFLSLFQNTVLAWIFIYSVGANILMPFMCFFQY